jgi:NAD(P)H-dependent FMN reductase
MRRSKILVFAGSIRTASFNARLAARAAKELGLLNAGYAVRATATVFDTMDDLRREASANRLPIVLGRLVDAAHQFA